MMSWWDMNSEGMLLANCIELHISQATEAQFHQCEMLAKLSLAKQLGAK